ncbi:MAG: anti-sigma factor family protein [Mycobacterium sp.]
MSEKQMTCKELVELVTAYLECALDADKHSLFDAHLEYCDGCRNYLEQFRVTVRTMGRIRDDELDPAFRKRLLDAFRDFK